MRLISSLALSIKRYMVLLQLLLRGMRRAPATEPATIGHGEDFVKETRPLLSQSQLTIALDQFSLVNCDSGFPNSI